MALFALWPFLLLGQTQVFLTYPRIVALLESASTAATLAFMSALNFTVSNYFFFFPQESLVLGVSDLTLFYLEHRTVAFLSSAFIHPIRHLFYVSFPLCSVCDHYRWSGLFPGYHVLRGTS